MAGVEKLITEHIDVWTSAIKKRKSQGRGSNGKVELSGVKKLRELILELAVRGKLVPQDNKEEPACILLERISERIDQLIDSKKLKKPKKLPPITDDSKPYNLPQGWCYSRLGDFVSIIRGITFPASEKHNEPANGRVACLRTANVQHHIDWGDLLYVNDGFVKREEQYLVQGDIVMSMANSRELVGKVSFTEAIPTGKASFGGFLSVIRPYELSARFLMCVLRAPHIKNSLIGSASQTTNIANISLEKLNPLLVALPPLAEQHRIVAKVDELMALCDQLEQQTEQSLTAHQTLVEVLLASLTSDTSTDGDNKEDFQTSWQRIAEHFDVLFTTEASIEQLKQTILQLAVMGKLVPQNPADEPASVLLEKIAEEKAQLIADKKIKNQKPLPDITDEEKPFELPNGWEWVRFEDVVDIQGGITKGRKLVGRELVKIPYLSVANVQRSYLDLGYLKEVEIPVEEKEKYRVMARDLLITEGGDWDKVGRTAIWANELPYVGHQNHVFKARVFIKEQCEVWLEKYLNGPYARNYFAGSSKQTTNLASINKTQLRGCMIAMPPSNEMQLIVTKIDELMALCDQLKARLRDAQTTQLHLADAVVENALT
jgi:type I restriction enzyme S subunit